MTLLTTVLTLIQQLNCSVLPLHGKKPLGPWKHLTQRKPTPQELESWFTNPNITSYGILLGTISSHLIGLDFDSETHYQDFQAYFPQLSQSFTVRSRRGYHIYLRTEHNVRTQRFPYGELLGKHSYLVGPGSQIHTAEEVSTYTIQNNSKVQQINQKQLQAVITWLGGASRAVTPLAIATHQQQTLTQLAQHYQQTAANGRNHALYTTALRARHAGWSLDQISPTLTTLHITTPPPGPHLPETPQQRQQEATRTLHSAYSHARNTSSIVDQGIIPTNVHEALLQRFHGSTIPGRLLEALYRSPYKPGDTITQAQARSLGARFHIADQSIRACFSGRFSTLNPQGDRLFTPTTQTPCRDYDKTTTNSVGSPPAAYYRIPSIDELCQALGVEAQSSDRLRDADLCSAKAFRMALHRALIDRVQPEQSCRWHADRLAVSPRTIHRYNAALGVHSVPIYAYTPLSWG
ncbi:MAG: bifunctional DNA primase/polymerase, partial [Anaerolineae bacterium]|nr:bifunctional DNA primase/polymerase [Anaerolineae bacterium]